MGMDLGMDIGLTDTEYHVYTHTLYMLSYMLTMRILITITMFKLMFLSTNHPSNIYTQFIPFDNIVWILGVDPTWMLTFLH